MSRIASIYLVHGSVYWQLRPNWPSGSGLRTHSHFWSLSDCWPILAGVTDDSTLFLCWHPSRLDWVCHCGGHRRRGMTCTWKHVRALSSIPLDKGSRTAGCREWEVIRGHDKMHDSKRGQGIVATGRITLPHLPSPPPLGQRNRVHLIGNWLDFILRNH